MPGKRLGILISGRGSNFRAIAENISQGKLDAEIGIVISNREDAGGLAFARERNIPSLCLPSKGIRREDYDRELARVLTEQGVELVCLAGFMRLLGAEFVAKFPLRVLNIHPSLLPAFPGLDAQAQALRHGVKVSGCTVHFVNEDLDAGPIVLQSAVPVEDDDTVDSLSARILEQEHRIYTRAIRTVLSGRIRIEGRRVITDRGDGSEHP